MIHPAKPAARPLAWAAVLPIGCGGSVLQRAASAPKKVPRDPSRAGGAQLCTSSAVDLSQKLVRAWGYQHGYESK